jgi:DNA-binding GntR family transcriptional regulator
MHEGDGVTAQKSKTQPAALSQAEVVDVIRQGILANELAPGQRLVEAELCKLLGTGRGAVRAALIDLAHEGLVERIANRGARVRIVSLEEALEIAQIRLAIETVVVSQAAEKVTDEDARRLRELAAQLNERADQGDAAGFAQFTHQILETYVAIAQMPIAGDMLGRLRALNSRHRFRLTYRPGRAKVAAPFWLDLVEAICNRDPKGARQTLRRHAENVQEAMMALARERTPFSAIYPGADDEPQA